MNNVLYNDLRGRVGKVICLLPDGSNGLLISIFPSGQGYFQLINNDVYGLKDYRFFSIDDVVPYLYKFNDIPEHKKKEYRATLKEKIVDNKLVVGYKTAKTFDWLNDELIDYRKLDEQGLCIIVTKDNNVYEQRIEAVD